jgi:predicted MFS family arabinose efflux permease
MSSESQASSAPESGVSRFQLIFMSLTCTLIVGNLYYNQPLLGILARAFSVSDSKIALVPACTLIGYALGILFIVPLGDMLERKKLLQISMVVAAGFAFALSFSPNFECLCLFSFLMGFTNVSASILIPFAANIAKPDERGKVVGIVLSGILLGSLIARTLAGFIGQHLGWQHVFQIAGAISLVLAVLTQKVLPNSVPHFKGTYKGLLISIAHLVRDLPVAREAAIVGAILFGSFSAFWTTLTFLLEKEPFHFSPQVIGLFGALGAIGALAAPIGGRYADKHGSAATLRMGIVVAMLAFIVLGLSTTTVVGLVVGVLLLDLGIQVAHISNQTRIFELNPEARSRLNTIYIFAYFSGGSLGSYIGSKLWAAGGWRGVCLGGLAFCLVAAVIFQRGHFLRKNKA